MGYISFFFFHWTKVNLIVLCINLYDTAWSMYITVSKTLWIEVLSNSYNLLVLENVLSSPLPSVLFVEEVWHLCNLFPFLSAEVTLERLQSFIPLLLSNLHMEGLFHGNLAQEQASSTMETLENILKTNSRSKPLLPSQLKRQREIQLPDGEIRGKGPIDTLCLLRRWWWWWLIRRWERGHNLI